ncbi:hypothetical protein ACKWTF_003858 [Chironomus riparius]
MDKNFTNQRFTGDIHLAIGIMFVFFEIIYAIVAVIFNFLVLIAFIKTPKLRRQTNYYVISLVMADFLMGLIGIPYGVLMPYIDMSLKHTAICVSRATLLLSFCNISILSLVFISLKRYNILSVNKPRNDAASTKNVIIEIIICSILGCFTGFIPFLSSKEWDQACSFGVYKSKIHISLRIIFLLVLPIIILRINYFKIHQIVLKQINFERRVKITRHDLNREKRRELRTTTNISLIMLIFIITWMPVHIIYGIAAFNDTIVISKNVLAIFVLIAHSNVIFHPFMYTYRMTDIRSAVFNLFRNNNVLFDLSVIDASSKLDENKKLSKIRLRYIINGGCIL